MLSEQDIAAAAPAGSDEMASTSRERAIRDRAGLPFIDLRSWVAYALALLSCRAWRTS